MMLLERPRLIYVDGVMVPYQNATIHVASIAAKYGANVFEGLCAYSGGNGRSYLFRVREHLARLHNSVRVMQIASDWTDEDYVDAIVMSLRDNGVTGDAHIRLTVFITCEGFCEGSGPASLVCTVTPRGPAPLETRGVHAAFSTWRRIDDTVMPPRVKAGANYQNSRFALLEARRNGYGEPLFLTLAGKVSEGASASLFMVRHGTLVTPPATAAILESVTRATMLDLGADELGLRVQEREIDRSELYAADEAFLCGSAQEVRPILSVDRFPLGDGKVGPVTRCLWNAYEAAVRGRNTSRAGWLIPVQAQPWV
jgi:branched-chain amino acid aminotransferase